MSDRAHRPNCPRMSPDECPPYCQCWCHEPPPPDAGEKGAGAFFASSGIVYMKQTDEMKGGIVWMCKDISEGDSLAETLNLIYGDGLAAGRRQERERCAKIAHAYTGDSPAAEQIELAIRRDDTGGA